MTTVFLLSVERYLSVCHPAFFQKQLTRNRTNVVIVMTWALWTCFSAFGILISWNSKEAMDRDEKLPCFLGEEYINKYHLLVLVILFAMHQIPMWFFQIKTLQVAQMYLKSASDRFRRRGSFVATRAVCGAQKDSGCGATQQNGAVEGAEKLRRYSSAAALNHVKRAVRRSQRTTRLIFSVMGCFSLCWTPYMAALGVYCLCPGHCGVTQQLFTWLGIPVAFNLFCNAFIFAVKSKEFRIALNDIRKHKCFCREKSCQ